MLITKNLEKKQGAIAISQIILLLASMIAFGYIVGSEFKIVSAAGECTITQEPVSSISNVASWCIANGGSNVCTGGSGNWKLITVPCVTPANPTNPSLTETQVQAAAIDSLLSQTVSRALPTSPVPTAITVPSIPLNLPSTLTVSTGAAASGEVPSIFAGQKIGLAGRASAEGWKTSIFNPDYTIPGVGGDVSVTSATGTPATQEAAKASSGNMLQRFLGKSLGGDLTIGGLLANAGWAATIYYGVKIVFGKLGVGPEVASSAAYASAGGFFVAKTLSDLGIISGGLAATGVFLGVGAIIFIATYKKTKYELVSFTCQPWDAQTGGANCEKCNEGTYPCTEYQCRSLGQGCQLVNPDSKGEELCVWVNRGDVKPPVIQPWQDALTLDYKYTPNNAISPPDRGVNIVRSADNGCIKPFTPLKFGVTLDEPAKCKIDFSNTPSFDDMKFFFGGSSTSKYNHSQTMSLPSPEALAAENITLENGAEFDLFTRCQDANGNVNTANFVFSFCVDEGPDTTAPLIVTTSILNDFPIAAGQTSADLQVYTNEPSECRWSQRDQSYDNMENQMSCSSNVFQMNSQNLYSCSTTLTGLKDRVKNDFYFRCKDQPHLIGTDKENERNANTQSYKFTLQGTQPLVLNSVGPNGTIRDATDVIKVTLNARTSAGYKNGEATCYFNREGDGEIEFYNTGTYNHTQDLYLPEGDYTYNIRCVDLGGNTDSNTTSFHIETDTEAPIVVRAFHQETSLKLITDENSACVYDNFNCNYAFEDGIEFTSTGANGGTTHSTEWTLDKDFYVKCADEFENQPAPDECSIVVRPSEI